MQELTLYERIKRAQAWLDTEINREYRRLSRDRAYIDNKAYFDRIRIKPLEAIKRLIHDLEAQVNESDKKKRATKAS